jgi:hypothetical protein
MNDRNRFVKAYSAFAPEKILKKLFKQLIVKILKSLFRLCIENYYTESKIVLNLFCRAQNFLSEVTEGIIVTIVHVIPQVSKMRAYIFNYKIHVHEIMLCMTFYKTTRFNYLINRDTFFCCSCPFYPKFLC